ncbi:tetratricopeptide repeat protein [Streptomyces sp. NPDC048442]|uniref:ATP-binding protein n=1 Tax=Streptomyces sp. NPDC048442 TaxID=3154823 RepID=UPI003430C4AE
MDQRARAFYEELRALENRARAAKRAAGRGYSRREVGRAVKRYGAEVSAQRVSDWLSDTAGRAKVPSPGSSEQVWALVRLWSHWAGEVPNERYWRTLLDHAQPVERGRATAPAAARFSRQGEGGVVASSDVSSLRRLPRDVAAFTGRVHELEQLVATGGSTGGVTVRTVDGMPGVGKTALVTRAAHLLADRFPDGQIFIRLHAHTPGQRPAEPAEVLAGLLAGVVGAAQQIPVDLDSRAALWRGHLAGRRMLLVLDDAVDHAQVEPLLPAIGDCLVLVTSRRRLVAMEGAAPLSLEVLPQRQAAELFTRLIHRAATDSSTDAEMVDEMVRLCGCLPLAISLLAGRLAHHPAWSIAQLAADFIATRDRLDELHAGDRTVAAAFELSYRDLPADRQRLFRRIGLHPGPDIDARAAAALDDIPLARARRELDALYTDHLIDEQAPGRYRPHDLVRDYARTLVSRDPAEDRERAVTRLLDHYQNLAEAADRHLSLAPRPVGGAALDTELGSREEALVWMHAERANLFACADHAAATGEHARVVRLAAAMTAFLYQEGPWQQAAALQDRAVAAAARSGDRHGQASALTALGHVRLLTNDYAAAVVLEERALALYGELGDRHGQAQALTELGRVLRLVNDYPAATERQRQALALQRNLGDRHGEAEALTELGFVRYRTNDYAEAAELQEQALTLYWDLRDRHGEAGALSRLGFVRFRTGDYPAAATLQDRARLIYWELGARQGEANVLTELGHIEIVTGRHGRAVEPLERALTLYRDLGDRHGEADALTELGRGQTSAGNFAQATALLEQTLELLRQLGDHLHEAYVLTCLGRVRTITGQHAEAAELLLRSLALRQELGDARGEAEALNALGDLLVESAGTDQARARYEQALRLTAVVPNPLEEGRALEGISRCKELDGALSDALADIRGAVGIYRRLGAAEAEPAAMRLARLAGAVRSADSNHPPVESPARDDPACS